jgi:hypothetical protein
MQIAFSSRKMAFSAAKVKANGTPIATTFPLLFPMTCCAQPVTLPFGAAPTNCLNTACVGVTWIDAILGWGSVIATVIIDELYYSKPKAFDITKTIEDWKWKLLLGDKPWKWLDKTVVGAVIGVAKIIFTGESSVSIPFGSGYLGGSLSYSHDSDGSDTVSFSGSEVTSDRLLGPAKGKQLSAQKTWRADGTSTTTTVSKAATADSGFTTTEGAQTSSSTATTYDKDGNVVSTTTTTTTKTEDTPWSGNTQIQQQKTTTKPGEAPKTSSSSYSGASKWGRPL